MDRHEIFAKVQHNLAAITDVEDDTITEETSLVEDLDADSLDLLQLVVSFQDTFGISVGDGEVRMLLTGLARFLPDEALWKDELSDDELAEVTQRLRVATVVDFVSSRVEGVPA